VAIENEQLNHKKNVDTWKTSVSWSPTSSFRPPRKCDRFAHAHSITCAQLNQADLTVGFLGVHALSGRFNEMFQIKNQADTIAQLRQESINWRDQYARVEKSCQDWKELFMRAEQERIRLLDEFEQLRDSVFFATVPLAP
jgi:hypothetical protein